ncbi:MAG: chorismate mutase [Kiritimatiellae bacterium]|nr:chorismate mutase [Kiritimatiellia bacterium]
MDETIESIRDEINEVDDALLKLFLRRMEASQRMAEAKRNSASPVHDPARERDILTKVAHAVGPDLENEARLMFTTLMSISRGRQRAELAGSSQLARNIENTIASTPDTFPSSATIACPGIEGSYSQQAACRITNFPTIFYFKGFDDVFSAVEKGMCNYGILPIENSAVGSVTAVYDLMAKHNFKIVRSVKLRVRHVLLAPHGTKLEDVKEISSHPHAIAQCSEFLHKLPGIRAVPATNTAAAAAEIVASGRKDVAVIASRECAELYGLEIIKEDVANTSNNYTRFICISKSNEIYPDANKFSVMMSLGHRPGALTDVLVKFAAIGVNLTKLESRPVPGSDFEFRFIFDFEATPRDSRVVKMLSGFSTDPDIEHFTFLGAYSEK